jgi:signal transduction histidine kinase
VLQYRVTIRARFTFAFLVVSLAGLLLAAALLLISRRNLRRVEAIVQVYDVIEHKSLKLSLDLLVMSDAIRGFLLNPQDSAEHARKLRADEQFTRDITEIRALSPGPEITRLIEAAQRMDAESLDRLEDRVLELAAAGKGDDARHVYSSEYLPLRGRQIDLIGQVEDQAALAQRNALNEMRDEDRRGLWLAAALFACAIAVSALAALYLSRSVVAPLARAAATANAAREGDWSVRVALGRRPDEIGALSRALDSFLDSLQETGRLANEIASGDLKIQVRPRSERDQLGHALERMVDSLARAQKELIDRERLAALGELSASVAHEVRNPLGVIFNSVGSLRRLLKPRGDVALLLDIVGEEADRLNRMVADLLDYARPVRPDLEPLPLRPLVGEAVAAARQQIGPAAEGVKSILNIEPGAEMLRADARLLRQALINLFLNAYQAMPRSGMLEVRASRVERDHSAVSELHIKDTGVGIPADVREKIFQPFFTTKAMGTGLGLAVVRRIIEGHGGSIELAATEGGTDFRIELPLEGGTRQA